MRRLVLLFALIGTAGAGFAGVSGLRAVAREETALRAAAAENPGAFCGTPLARLETAGNALIAAVPLGLLGGVLVLRRWRKAAAAVLLAAYALPVTFLGGSPPPDMERVGLLAPIGLAVAGVLALFIPRTPVPPPPAHRFGHPVEYDMVR